MNSRIEESTFVEQGMSPWQLAIRVRPVSIPSPKCYFYAVYRRFTGFTSGDVYRRQRGSVFIGENEGAATASASRGEFTRCRFTPLREKMSRRERWFSDVNPRVHARNPGLHALASALLADEGLLVGGLVGLVTLVRLVLWMVVEPLGAGVLVKVVSHIRRRASLGRGLGRKVDHASGVLEGAS